MKILIGGSAAFVDIALVVICCFFVLFGLKKGFAKSFLSFFGFAFSFLIAFLLKNTSSMILDKLFNTTNMFSVKVANYFSGISSSFAEHISKDPNVLKGLISSSNMSTALKKMANSAVGTENFLTGETVCSLVGEKYGVFLTIALGVVLTFIVVRIALFFASKLITLFNKNPLFNKTDKILGGVFGGCKAICVVLAFVFSLSLVSKIPSLTTRVSSFVDNSVVVKACYNELDKYVFVKVCEDCEVYETFDGVKLL